MALTDAPDGTLWVQQVNVVVDTPTPPEPANEVAAGDAGRYSGSATTYQTVASWTVATGKVGELVYVVTNGGNLTNARIKVTIGAKVYTFDVIYVAPTFYYFSPLKLAAGTVVKVEARAITGGAGNEITVEAIITGKEIG